MSASAILFIALGLAMDAFAVSVAGGVAIKRHKLKSALKFGAYFGSFQMAMPVIGWATGFRLKGFITGIDHWVAFGLLAFIGGKMIYESLRIGEEEKLPSFGHRQMLVLSVTTSIDALAAGLSFAFLQVPIILPVLVIGAVTFSLSFIGVVIGNTAGHFFEKKLEAAGGFILIAIGIKILLEHLR
ncbi:MAG TPA: manganese efflux pump MntP family protein [Candidatus Omnitrophota bacterium]|nr:manganese efflux pump MntP family protein [Candidatus Omnitrophota bacterium]